MAAQRQHPFDVDAVARALVGALVKADETYADDPYVKWLDSGAVPGRGEAVAPETPEGGQVVALTLGMALWNIALRHVSQHGVPGTACVPPRCEQDPCRIAGLSFAIDALAEYLNLFDSPVAVAAEGLARLRTDLMAATGPYREAIEPLQPLSAKLHETGVGHHHDIVCRGPRVVLGLLEDLTTIIEGREATLRGLLPVPELRAHSRTRGRRAQRLWTALVNHLHEGGFSTGEITDLVTASAGGPAARQRDAAGRDSAEERVRKVAHARDDRSLRPFPGRKPPTPVT